MQVITPNTKLYLLLALVFAIVISFNFTRPFGFFRESNPALVAINATYWKANPGIRKQHIPVASYAFRKDLSPATQFDNTITTFGYGWFAAPYYFLELTNLPAGPVGLRIFSCLWLLFTVVAVYKLAGQLSKLYAGRKLIIFFTIILYVFSPVVMWYQVNGYVHETAVLPFYYFGWYFFLRLLEKRETKWLWLTAITLFVAIQFDWLPFFQGLVMSAYLLFSNKGKPGKWMFLIPGACILLGIIYMVWHYASWASVHDYFNFMRWKFGTRTIGEEGPSYISFWPAKLNIFLFYVISYGVLLLWCIAALVKRKFHPLLLLMVITAVLHHIVFWGFSSEHDYAALKMAFPIAFTAALLLGEWKNRNAVLSISVIVSFAIAQYFLLHNYSYRRGIYADSNFFYRTGSIIKNLPPGAIVFVNTEGKYFPQLEFYSQRAYKMAVSAEDARQQLKPMDYTSAFFISTDGKVVALVP